MIKLSWLAKRRPQQAAKDTWLEYYADQAEASLQPALRSFYAAGVVPGNTLLQEAPFVALDLEATGLNPRRNSVLSVGLVPFSAQRIYPNQGRHWIVKPEGDLTGESVKYHHITHADVENAPLLTEVLDDVLTHLQGRIVVCHYHQIERYFLRHAVQRNWQEELMFPIVDTMYLERQILKKSSALLVSRLRRQEVASLRLSDSRRRYGLPLYMAHHAFVDALATAELLQAQLTRNGFATKRLRDVWC